MKRYNLTPNGVQVDDNGVWVRAEDAKRLRDALSAMNSYWNSGNFTRKHDLWDVMRAELINSASLASCSLSTTNDQT
jgi:hypothetical protein